MKRNIFGQFIIVKNLLIKIVAIISYPGFQWVNKLKVEGAEIISKLPERGVVFVSNHQTYFADVVGIYHGIFSALVGKPNNTRFPAFLFKSKHNIYFVAAEETMKSGFLPKIFRYGGAVTVKRTWREKGEAIQREVDLGDSDKINRAIKDGWVITFPQGTTSPFVLGRKGTAHTILSQHPVVVPVVINGFRRAFDKRGMIFKKKKTELQVMFKSPIDYSLTDTVDELLEKIICAIEQSPEHLKVKEV